MGERVSEQSTQIADFEEERKASVLKLTEGERAQNLLQLKAKEVRLCCHAQYVHQLFSEYHEAVPLKHIHV